MFRNQNDMENTINNILGVKGSEKLITFPGSTNERIGNFSTVYDEVSRINQDSFDVNAHWGDVKLRYNNDELYLNLQGEDKDLLFGSNGLNQFCNEFGVPSQYIKKCLVTDNVKLAYDNLESWKSKSPNKEKLLRFTDDRLHGVLSNRYTIFDDHEVLEIVNDIVGSSNEYDIKNFIVNPEIMKARFVSNEKITINGDELSVGFDVRNSRVGRSSLEISIILFRWICSNGMIFGGGRGLAFRKVHVGVGRDVFVREFTELLNSIPDAVAFIRDNVNSAQDKKLNDHTIQMLLNKFKSLRVQTGAVGRVESVVNEELISGRNITAWDFVNHITHIAKDYSVDTRSQIEEAASQILIYSKAI